MTEKRKCHDEAKRRRVCELYQAGLKIVEVAAEVGIARSTAWSILDQCGVARRASSGRVVVGAAVAYTRMQRERRRVQA